MEEKLIEVTTFVDQLLTEKPTPVVIPILFTYLFDNKLTETSRVIAVLDGFETRHASQQMSVVGARFANEHVLVRAAFFAMSAILRPLKPDPKRPRLSEVVLIMGMGLDGRKADSQIFVEREGDEDIIVPGDIEIMLARNDDPHESPFLEAFYAGYQGTLAMMAMVDKVGPRKAGHRPEMPRHRNYKPGPGGRVN